MIRFLPYFLVLLLTGACGGEIHFVSPRVQANVPPPPPAKAVFTVDNFRYASPSGTVAVNFVFYPLKTMAETLDQVDLQILKFLNEFWSRAELYDDVRFSASLDSTGGSTSWFSPGESLIPREKWNEQSSQFFKTAIPTLKDKLERDGTENLIPIEAFTRLSMSLSSVFPLEHQAPWVHFIYFRNRDILIGPKTAEEVTQAKDSFKRSFSPPLSPFRYHVNWLEYKSKETPCAPSPTKLGNALESFLSQYPGRSMELCQLDGSVMKELAREIHLTTRRMILRTRPKLETLTVNVCGTAIPKETVIYNEAENELTLSSAVAIGVGDPVQVRYEARN